MVVVVVGGGGGADSVAAVAKPADDAKNLFSLLNTIFITFVIAEA